MEERHKIFQVILICGGLWGAAEATLGYLLHFLPCGFSGMLMFPIGFYFMMNAYKVSQRHSVIFFTAIIAAGIKLVDLVLPSRSPMSIVNPAASILLEALVVFVFVRFFVNKRVYLKSIGLGLSWVILLIVSQAFVFQPSDGLYLRAPGEMLAFILMNALVSGGLVGIYLMRPKFDLPVNLNRLSYGLPGLILIFAIICEIGNSLL